MNIDHIQILNTSNTTDSDRIQVESASLNGNNVNVTFRVGTKLSARTKQYLAENNNYCYVILFHRASDQHGHPGRHSKRRRHQEAHKWYPRESSKKQIRFSSSGNIFDASFDKSDFIIDNDNDRHKFNRVDWDYYYGRFKLKFIVGEIGHTGHISCYSDFNSDEIRVFYNDWR